MEGTFRMKRRQLTRTMRDGIALLAITAACGSDSKTADQPAAESSPSATTTDARVAGAPASAAAELTAADLDAYARGLARETELVRAAQERARTASTPQARGEAQQAQWEDQTIPEGAKAAGLSPDRYRAVRGTVHRTFQWLDFQGKIDGPMELDTAHASPDMKQQFARDPFAELSPDSRAALQAMMDRLVPSWVEYVKLTAVAG
jgi:hypothetical protein